MADQETLLRRIRKTLELAKRDEGGEKETAERMLEALLKKADLTLDDIEGEHLEVNNVKFICTNFYEKSLLYQTVAMVTNTRNPVSYILKNARSKLRRETEVYKLTKIQELEVNLHYDIMKVALKDALVESLSAFLVANNIFADSPAIRKSDSELSPEELLKRRRIELMAFLMPKTLVHKAIEQ